MIIEKNGIKHYYIIDIESGCEHEVSKEYYEGYKRMWALAFKPLEKENICRPILFGTGGNFKDEGLKEMFYNPEKYKILNADTTWNRADEGSNLGQDTRREDNGKVSRNRSRYGRFFPQSFKT